MTEPAHDPIAEQARRAAVRLLEARASLAESLTLDGSSVYGLDPRDLGIGDHPGFYPMPPTSAGLTWLNRMRRGEFVPAFLTEQQLSIYRRRIRALVVNSEVALNAVNTHQSYAVGEGFRYEAGPRTDDPAPHLVASAQAVIDAFVEHNEMALREAEVVSRTLIDGEALVRLFPGRNGILSLRFVEPEHCWSPTGDSDENSFGVRTPADDVESVEGYWLVQGDPNNTRPELVDAAEVVHFKHPETPSTSKRGLSAFYPVETTLRAAEDLLASTVSLAKARAKIAWFRKLDGGLADVASALVNNQAAATATDPATGQAVNMERLRYGSVLTIPSTMDIEFPSANIAASEHVEIMQMVLRMVAARFSMPEYMLSADASNANYASTLVAESPFVKAMQRLQDWLARLLGRNRYGGHRRSLVWRQLACAVESGLLPADVFRLVDVQVTGPSLVVRDVAKEAQVDKIQHELRIKSRTTIQLEQGLDPDVERANFAKEAEEPKQQPQAGAGPLAGAGGGQSPPEPEAVPTPESLDGRPQEPWLVELLEAGEARKPGDKWKGPSGRWFTKKSDGRVVPTADPEKERKPKAGAKKDKPAPEKPAAGKAAKADPAALKARIGEMLKAGRVGPDDARELADGLMSLTVAQLDGLKKELGLKASGVKAELAKKLAERALAGGAKPGPEKKPARKPAAKKDAAKAEPHAAVADAILSHPGKMVSVADLAEKTGMPLAELHRAIDEMRGKGLLSMSASEGHDLPDAERDRLRAAAIDDHGERLAYVEVRHGKEGEVRTLAGRKT